MLVEPYFHRIHLRSCSLRCMVLGNLQFVWLSDAVGAVWRERMDFVRWYRDWTGKLPGLWVPIEMVRAWWHLLGREDAIAADLAREITAHILVIPLKLHELLCVAAQQEASELPSNPEILGEGETDII